MVRASANETIGARPRLLYAIDPRIQLTHIKVQPVQPTVISKGACTKRERKEASRIIK